MTTWQDFAQSRAPKNTFLKRITTLEGFSNACTDSSFLAIRIKDIKKTSDSDCVLLQVGLAYLPSLEPGEFLDCSSANMPSLIQFYNKKSVRAWTINVLIRQDEKDQILALRDIPVRRNVRLGTQLAIHPDLLGDAVTSFLLNQGYFHDNKRNLVCVSFNPKGWKYMRDYFPAVMSRFSAYMDLRDIARDAAPDSGPIPGLKSCIELFNFDGELQQTEKAGRKADNAGEHAVAVCAFANILLSSENQRTFKYKLECGLMAQCWESEDIRMNFSADARYFVSVRTEAREALPFALESSWRIAQEFHGWNPKYAVKASYAEAYLQFHNESDVQDFIQDVNGKVYPTGETLSVTTHEERQRELQQEPGQQDLGNQEEDEQQEEDQPPKRHTPPPDDWVCRCAGRGCHCKEEETETEIEDEKEEQKRRLSHWDQKEEWAQEQEWGQQEETRQEHCRNSARECWTPDDGGEEKEEENELHASGWFGEDEKPEFEEVNSAADWDLVSD
ncbi:hypothetical protein NW768_001118 [Fusarium equiseti]|uniref:Uncharacterized protein n=1 Tax=Fusarium equiseti TaxID=61235 RepID=A0ABQ8RQ74_FUSEQ|nr:hypothetical protein NW768_001118 [Fusarium equiseti]